MKVIGTAGHIDHGKSTLVHRLTGIDPDRLEEEKRRGMTIDLGFAWLTLPSGLEVSVVDVPGHERFIKNMLAGAAGIDVALLVVAADESVMPQTREHLDILHLLGVERGVVALTKSDLVDGEWLALVTEEVAETISGTVLEGSPIISVSSTTGEGIGDLLNALEHAVDEAPAPHDTGVPFLPIDRVFTVAGFGTVVTGTLHGGQLGAGEDVEIVPGNRRVRIRGMQSHRSTVSHAGPGDRVAVNVSGVTREEVRRGDVLASPGSVTAVRRFDAHLSVLPDAPFALTHGLQTSLHIGSAERSATLSLLGSGEIAPGEDGWVQIRVADPVALVRGERFILRLPAPARTVAGGQVVDIEPRHRRSDGQALTRLAGLSEADQQQAMVAALAGERMRTVPELAVLLGLHPQTVHSILDGLVRGGRVVKLADRYLNPNGWRAVQARASRILDEFHVANALVRGMDREELRTRLRIARPVWPATLTALIGLGIVEEHGTQVALPGRVGGTAARQADVERVLNALMREPYSPPTGSELAAQTGVGPDLLRALVEEQRIVRLSDGLYLSRDAYEAATAIIVSLAAHADVTVAEVRDTLGTTRKYALALLEYLDAEKITRRMGDVRVLGPKAATCV